MMKPNYADPAHRLTSTWTTLRQNGSEPSPIFSSPRTSASRTDFRSERSVSMASRERSSRFRRCSAPVAGKPEQI